MYLWHIFVIKPFAALSILICLATIFSLFSLERRRPHLKVDRFLIGFLGLLSVYQGLRILESAGFVTLSSNTKLDDAIELIVTMFYLMAALLLRFSSNIRLDAESAMRLARAAPPRVTRNEAAIDASRPLNSTEKLSWILPKVSDGAFKLYAYLSFQADPSMGRVTSEDHDLGAQLGKTAEEIQGCLRELERISAIAVTRSGSAVSVDLNARPNSTASSEELPAALSAIRN